MQSHIIIIREKTRQTWNWIQIGDCFDWNEVWRGVNIFDSLHNDVSSCQNKNKNSCPPWSSVKGICDNVFVVLDTLAESEPIESESKENLSTKNKNADQNRKLWCTPKGNFEQSKEEKCLIGRNVCWNHRWLTTFKLDWIVVILIDFCVFHF